MGNLKKRPLFEYATGHKLLFVLGTAAVTVIERLGVTEELAAKIVLETRVGGPLSAVHEGKAEAAKAFVVFLRGASVAPILRSKGME
jgi:hypothetical protein